MSLVEERPDFAMSVDTIFIDESGYTGPDLLNPDQPVLAVASHVYSERQSRELRREFFSDVRAQELKYASMSKYPKHRKAILRFLKEVPSPGQSIKLDLSHKRFALVAKVVDLFVVEDQRLHGRDLYDEGHHIPLSNALWHILPSLGGEQYFSQFLSDFQLMLRDPSPDRYEAFFRPIRLIRSHETLDWFLELLRCADRHLGPSHLFHLRGEPEIAHAAAAAIVYRWASILEAPTEIIPDRSSALLNNFEVWQAITNPDNPPSVVGKGEHQVTFPLPITKTEPMSSLDWNGLQIADVLAGAAVDAFKWRFLSRGDPDYGRQLWRSIEPLHWNAIWPTTSLKPIRGTGGEELIAYTMKAIENLR